MGDRSLGLPLPALRDEELRRWLADDAPHGDLTTFALAIGKRAAGRHDFPGAARHDGRLHRGGGEPAKVPRADPYTKR